MNSKDGCEVNDNMSEVVLDSLHTGVCVWRLEEDDTPATLRLVLINPVGARFLRVEISQVLGLRIHEAFPGSETQPLPAIFTSIAMQGGARELGIVPYSDEVLKDNLFAIRAERIAHRTVCVQFENVTEQKRLEALQVENDALLARDRAQAQAMSEEADRNRRLVIELEQQLEIIATQGEQIQALSAPILDIWDGVVAVPIIGELTGARAELLSESLLEFVSSRSARAVILDVTGISGLNAETAEYLGRIVAGVRLLGAEGVVTGIRPQLAQTLASLGQDSAEFRTYRTLSDGLRVCIGRQGPQKKNGR
jgi:anti-anti-sigma regulatory factor